jgi:hypothetical protein
MEPSSVPTSNSNQRSNSNNRSNQEDLRSRSGATPAFNAHADRTLMQRFRDCEHSKIPSMVEGHNVQIPKIGNAEVCLAWALKGECSSTCKRKNQHVRYNQPVVDKIHQLMTDCGVPAVQQ